MGKWNKKKVRKILKEGKKEGNPSRLILKFLLFVAPLEDNSNPRIYVSFDSQGRILKS